MVLDACDSIPSMRMGDFYIDFYGDFIISFVKRFWSEMVRKAFNGVIMGDKYSQRPYGDFWTRSGTNFFAVDKNSQTHGNVRRPKKHVFVRVVLRNARFTVSSQYQNKHALRELRPPIFLFGDR